jgi:RNase P/RNase MRP subunit p29
MKEELIGKKAEIAFNGKVHKGTIVDETKNMIHLKTDDGLRKFIKQTIIIKTDKIIEGKKITKRPEDRIKAC